MGLSRRLGLRLRVPRYPPDTPKWHPIEQRLFIQVDLSLSGIILDSPRTALAAGKRIPPKPATPAFTTVSPR